ncbi:MAG TPA: GerMN domain-containing protein [Firmicutes bacterium]|nr:GerMN domain-containing protein [Bacillota bacterium]
MTRINRTMGAIVVAIAMVSLTGCFGIPKPKAPEQGPPLQQPGGSTPDVPQATQPSVPAVPQAPSKIRIYLVTPDVRYLVPITLNIEGVSGNPQELAAKLVTSWAGKLDLKSPFPADTTVRSVSVKDGIATVDLSKTATTGMGSGVEALAVESLVRTMTSFQGINKVRILVEGKSVETLAGHVDVSRPLSPPPTINHDGSQPADNTMKVVLWFAGSNYLIPVTRFIPKTVSAIKAVVSELIKGPQGLQGLSPTIPAGTKLLGTNLKDGIAYVDFSKELKTKHWGGSFGESITVNSIVYTVTEFPTVSKVQILIAGKKGETIAGHIVLDSARARGDINPFDYKGL